MRHAGDCPWCRGRIALVDAAELRGIIAGLPGQQWTPELMRVAADFPCWWCSRCRVGGLVFRGAG